MTRPYVITGPTWGERSPCHCRPVWLAQWVSFLAGECGSPCMTTYFQPETYGKPGLSSFASEVLSLKEALSRREEKGLILLDEVGRGTNPAQGLALYAAILDYLRETRESRATVIASTHFHGLAKALDVPHWQVAGLVPDAGAIDAGSIGKDVPKDINWLYKHMDYRLQRVGPDTPTPQDALLVARVLGLNGEIVTRAEAFVNKSKESGGLP